MHHKYPAVQSLPVTWEKVFPTRSTLHLRLSIITQVDRDLFIQNDFINVLKTFDRFLQNHPVQIQ